MAGNGSEALCEQYVRGFGCFGVQRRLLKIRVRVLSLLQQRMPNLLQHLFFCRRRFYVPLQSNFPLAHLVHVEAVSEASSWAGLSSKTPELSPTPSCTNPSRSEEQTSELQSL